MTKMDHKDAVADVHLPVTSTRRDVGYEGFRRVATHHYREDESGLEAKREIVEARDAVALVVHDPSLDKLVLIRQFRLGAQMGVNAGMSVEIVAGLIDDGEDPENCARRELMEETGLTATNLKPLCKFLTTPGMTNEVIHLFYAQVDAENIMDQGGQESETERTFPFLVSLDDALKAVDENTIYNGIIMLGLLWFQRHRDNLTAGAKA